MVDKAFEPGPLRRNQNGMQILARHGVAGVGMAPRGYPADHLFVIPNRVQCAPDLRMDNFLKERLREAHLVHVR